MSTDTYRFGRPALAVNSNGDLEVALVGCDNDISGRQCTYTKMSPNLWGTRRLGPLTGRDLQNWERSDNLVNDPKNKTPSSTFRLYDFPTSMSSVTKDRAALKVIARTEKYQQVPRKQQVRTCREWLYLCQEPLERSHPSFDQS